MSDTAMHFEYPPGASPAEIWAILREVAEGQKENRLQQQETDRRLKETDQLLKEVAEGQKETRLQMEDTDRRMKENAERQKETDRLIQENAEQQKENAERQKETDRLLKEVAAGQKETRLQMEDTDRQMKETAKQLKETDRNFGKLSNRFGELAEHLVIPNIMEKFNALGFTFTKFGPNVRIAEVSGKRIAELDILLENGDTAIVVEVKTKPSQDDVDDHVKRMEVLRRYSDARNDKRVFQGAVAGAIMTKEVRDYIIKNGFYVIEQSGDTVMINTPEGFKPRQW